VKNLVTRIADCGMERAIGCFVRELRWLIHTISAGRDQCGSGTVAVPGLFDGTTR